MKYTAAALLLVSLCCCRHGQETTRLFTPENLGRLIVSIDHTRDTTFRTPKGGLINIAAGTFDGDVELEIKEAYSLKDILVGGLTTTSNGKLLQTGGMVYINTANGKAIILNKPISVAVPTDYLEENMKLFKGEEKDGMMNWIETDTLQPTEQQDLIEVGKALFQSACASCHTINKKLTGPALAGFTERGPWGDRKNVYTWVHNPAAFIPTTLYTKALQSEYGSVMPSFPQFSEDAIDAIIMFIKNEERKSFNDSTAFDNQEIARQVLLSGTDSARYLIPDSVLIERGIIDTNIYPEYITGNTSALLDQAKDSDYFTDTTAAWYRFEMKTLGWFNIDQFFDKNTVPCEIKIKPTNVENEEHLNIHFIIPKRKVATYTFLESDGFRYLKDKNEKVNLILGDEAIVVAFSEGKFYYGQTKFIIERQQTILVPMKKSTKEEVSQWLNKLEW